MSMRTRLAGGLRALFRKSHADAELDDELRHYLDAAVEAKMAAGLSREQAVRAARADIGSTESVKDGVRDVGWEARLESFWQDVRYALRLLRRSPAFAASAVVPLALGIGAAVAIYSVAYGILLRPLPVHDEASLVVAYATSPIRSDDPISHPRFDAWRDSGIFQDLAATTIQSFDIVSDGLAERVRAAAVTGDLFGVLGVTALHGRVLAGNEPTAGAGHAPAVISYPLWKTRFASDPAVVGRTITAGIYRLTIVGVAPPGFDRWRGEAHVWVPVHGVTAPAILASDGYRLFTPIGRLRAGIRPAEAQNRLASVDRAFNEVLGDGSPRASRAGVRLIALRDDVVPFAFKRVLLVLLGAVGLTWLVVCAHVAHMLLARGTRRASELAVRLAIGAHRRRVVRQLMVESLVLALPAGASGLVLAYWGVQLLVAFGPPGVVGNEAIRLDVPVAAFGIGATLVSALVFGVGPAVRVTRVSLQASLVDRMAPRRLSSALITVQLAMAVVVLAGAALLVKTVVRLNQVDLGFEPHNILTVQYAFPQRFAGARSAAPEREWRLAAQTDMVTRLAALPGVDQVTLANPLFRVADGRSSIWLDDGRRILNGNPEQRPFAPRQHRMGPGYFQIHRTRVLEGREFTGRDTASAPRVAIVNRTMARLHWPEGSPLGRRVNFGGWSPRSKTYDEPWHEIVGVVADRRYGGADAPILPEIYRSIDQEPLGAGYAILKTRVDPTVVAPAARDAIRAVDRDIPVYAARTLTDLVDESTAVTRYNSGLLSLCAAITTILCTFGIYSLLAYAIASRRRELGVRIALGAAPRRLVIDVLWQAAWLLIPGLAAGVLVAAFATQVLAGLLYEVSSRDPLVLAGAVCAVALLALGAAWLPARSAGRVDPMQALKM